MLAEGGDQEKDTDSSLRHDWGGIMGKLEVRGGGFCSASFRKGKRGCRRSHSGMCKCAQPREARKWENKRQLLDQRCHPASSRRFGKRKRDVSQISE